MAFTDIAHVAILSRLTDGVWTQVKALPSAVEDGFDTLDVVWIRDYKATVKTAIEVAAEFTLGTRYGSTDFWLRAAQPTRLGGNVWTVAGRYEGRISSGKPTKVKRMATQEIFTVQEATVSGLFTDEPCNVREANPSLEIGYVLVNAAPPTNLVGLVGTPAASAAVRAAYWSSLTTKRRWNFPSGWTFTDLNSDEIAGASPQCHYVRESWQYVHDRLPE